MGDEHGEGADVSLRVFGPCTFVAPPSGSGLGRTGGGSPPDTPSLSLAQRRLLERLALSVPAPVRLAQLTEALWEDEPPTHAKATIQNHISRLRSAWGEHVIRTTVDGYVLGVPTDAVTLRDVSAQAEILLERGDAEAAFDLAESVLPLWVGLPFATLDHVDGVDAARRALSASCKAAENTRLAAAIALGRSGWALHEAERLAAESPHDERRQAMRARALAIAGRRGDALASITATRRRLRTDLGLEAGPLLIAAEEEILAPADAPLAAHRLPFTGREDEVRIALAHLARGVIVRVQGEPGAGVTRVMAEIGTHLSVLGVRIAAIDALDHVDSAVSVLEAIVEEVDLDIDQSRGLVAGFASAAARGAEATPLAFLIDNADEVGPSARAAIKAAAGPRCLLVLGGHGFADSDNPAMMDLTLEPFDRQTVERLAVHATGHPLAPEHIEHLLAYSGGNPLALEVLLGAHPHEPESAFHDPESDSAPRLEALASALLRDLDPADRALVERAAVAGEGYPVDALADGIPFTTLPHGVVARVDGTVHFRHGALRDAVYFRVPPARREELHAELGRAARTVGAPAAMVARHLTAAGPLAGEEAADACRAAARDAARLGAHADAVGWLSLIETLPGLDAADRLAARIALGDEQRLSGDPAHVDTLMAAVDDAFDLGDERLLGEACFALLQLGGTTASGTASADVTTIVARALESLTLPAARAPVCGAASLVWSMTSDAGRARALFDEAERLADDDATRARVLPFAYMALGMPDDLGRRTVLTEELHAIGARLNDPIALFEAWQLAYSNQLQTGDGSGARGAVARMAEFIDVTGDVGRRWTLQFARACIAHLDGDDEACERHAADASALFSPVSPSRAAAAYSGQLLALRMTQGRLSELAPTLRELVTAQPGVPAWHAAYALATDDVEDAAQHATLALERTQPDSTWLAAHVAGGRAAARTGDDDLADRYLAALSPWTGLSVWQGACSMGPVDTALALLHRSRGDDTAATRHAHLAFDVARGLGVPFVTDLERLGFAPE